MQWVISDPSQNLGTCWLSSSQGLQGKHVQLKSLSTGGERRRGPGEQSCLIPKTSALSSCSKKIRSGERREHPPASSVPLNLFKIHAGALGNSQL